MGFGYTIKAITLDYSMGLQGLGTATHPRLVVEVRTLRPRAPGEKASISLIQKAFAAAQSGNYLMVQEQLQAALDLDPSNKNVQQLVEKFQKVVASVPSAMGQEESATMTRKALLYYANNDLKGTVAALRQAYYKDPPERKAAFALEQN